MQLLSVIGAIVVGLLILIKWKGQHNIPKMGAIAASIFIAGILFFLSLKYGKNTSLASLQGSSAVIRTAIVFVAILCFSIVDQTRWHGSKDRYKYLYAFVLGTLVTWILISFKRAFFETGIGQDPFLMALGILCIVIGWKFLFGPWSASIKATVLGTFIFWVTYAILRFETQAELIATGIAAVFAVIPIFIWCVLFLSYHRERLSVVILAFFAGMISTAPILFYSEIMKRGIELNFFIFKITPLNYGMTSRQFVSDSIFSASTGTTSIVLVTFVTYLWVGIIEEVSKFWVLRHSSREFFRSIDDTLQLAIMVALGFAFAENLVNPTYFVGFVKQYLLDSPTPLWGPLISSMVGRAILTTMVHVLSTGVLGYFFGLAFFSTPLLRDQFQAGKSHPVAMFLHRVLAIKTEAVFSRVQIVIGLFASITLHGLFDFIVSLPEVLPGNPATVGALLGMPQDAVLSSVGIVLVPALLYVVGGFWLLSYLFERKDDMKEYGARVESQSFVS